MTPDEQRALDWQAQRRRRLAFERSLQAMLKAPLARITQTKKNWDPLNRK